MLSLEITFLGLALAIDAAVVSFAMGLLSLQLTPGQKLFRGTVITLTFAFFQFMMLWLGSYGGYLFTFSDYGHLTQIMTALIFLIIAYKFFQEGIKLDKREFEHGFLPLTLLAVATSIDALAAGVSFGTFPHAYRAALEVGGITFIMCGVFFGMSQFLYRLPEKWLLFFGGFIFITLALRIIIPQYFQGIL